MVKHSIQGSVRSEGQLQPIITVCTPVGSVFPPFVVRGSDVGSVTEDVTSGCSAMRLLSPRPVINAPLTRAGGRLMEQTSGLLNSTRAPLTKRRRDLIVRTPRGTPPVAGIPPGDISYVTDQMNRIKPMSARLLNPAGASRGYIPDGHRLCKEQYCSGSFRKSGMDQFRTQVCQTVVELPVSLTRRDRIPQHTAARGRAAGRLSTSRHGEKVVRILPLDRAVPAGEDNEAYSPYGGKKDNRAPGAR
ncbi:hypothetical protein Bbelb_003740 [Branchiostoma belcheri]|nr:hypothetical protein Bbelb_003740 [Branchiostoma belcheri]